MLLPLQHTGPITSLATIKTKCKRNESHWGFFLLSSKRLNGNKLEKKQAQVLLHPPTGIVTLVYNSSGWNYTYYDIVFPYLRKGKYELKTTPERSGERAQQTSCPNNVSHTEFLHRHTTPELLWPYDCISEPNVKAIMFTWLLLTLFLYRYIVKHFFFPRDFPLWLLGDCSL